MAVALGGGCDPGWRLHGKVVSTSGEPVSGAEIATVCPRDQPPLPSARSGPDGSFDESGLGGFGNDCALQVSAVGFEAKGYPVSSVCRKRTRLFGCLEVELVVELARSR
jgi:hypothetical protein